MGTLRRMVLSGFKKLHQTRVKVFVGDSKALSAARIKINDEYRKNKHIKDEESIKAMVKFGEEVERELRTQVLQAKEVKPGVFEVKITEDTVKLDNIPFNDASLPDDKSIRPCCQEQSNCK